MTSKRRVMMTCRKGSLLLATSLAVVGVILLHGRTDLRLGFRTTTGNLSRGISDRAPHRLSSKQHTFMVPRHTVLKRGRKPTEPPRDIRFTSLAAYDTDETDNVAHDIDNIDNIEPDGGQTVGNIKALPTDSAAARVHFNESYQESLEKIRLAEQEQRERLANLKSACRRLVPSNRPILRGNLSQFYYSKDYNFAYCKVPKSGSTFWTKLFMALMKGDQYAQQMSRWPRVEIHSRSKVLMAHPARLLKARVPTIVVARNPYTRLYSAYVDKVYLPLFWEQFGGLEGAYAKPSYYVNTTKEILKGSKLPVNPRLMKYRTQLIARGLLIKQNVSTKVTPICANSATFEQFLEFVIKYSKNSRVDPHWSPISRMCHPCKFNTFRVVKQEAFTEDVESTLRSVNVDLEQFPSIHNTLHENRAQNSIPSIIGVVQNKAFAKTVNACISHVEMVKRVWKSLQIQGFIKDSVPFPVSLLDMQIFNKFTVTDAILDAIERNPMTSLEREQQRHSHVVDAYRTVDKSIIDEIRSIYNMDFQLFTYSTDPPS